MAPSGASTRYGPLGRMLIFTSAMNALLIPCFALATSHSSIEAAAGCEMQNRYTLTAERREMASGRYPGLPRQIAVKLQVVVNHPLLVIALARPMVGAVGVGAALLAIFTQFPNRIGYDGPIIGAEIDRILAPDFPEAGNVIGDEGAARKGGFQRFHAERLVARGGRVDRRPAVQRAQLGLGLGSLQRDTLGLGRDLHVGSYGKARRMHRRV